jgi:capsular polysaccharide transport system permease protein
LATRVTRSCWQILYGVWLALFLREILGRLTVARFAWFWMLLEPMVHVVMLAAIRELFGRVRMTMNAEYIPWLVVGLMTFFVFRDGVTRSIGAINANQALFAYRQVKPIDPVIVRVIIEGLMNLVVFMVLLLIATLLGYHLIPADPLLAMAIWFNVWLLGLGLGLVFSVLATLVDEVGKIVSISMLPLYFLSGAMLPLWLMPQAVQEIILYIPIVHGVELMRMAFFTGYHTAAGVDGLYLVFWTMSSIALGLALHLRFAERLRAS